MTQIFQDSLSYEELQDYLASGFVYQGVAYGGYGTTGQWTATPIVQLYKNVPGKITYSKYGEVAFIDYNQTKILIPQSVYQNALTAPEPTFTTPVEPSTPSTVGYEGLTSVSPNTPTTTQNNNGGAGGLILLALAVIFLGRKKWKF